MGPAAGVLYDAPSPKATPTLLIGAGSPVEVASTLDGWVKVRDWGGRLGWIEAAGLAARRAVVVSAPQRAAVLAAGSAGAAPVFEALRGVILELVDVSGSWARVRHRDGLEGFVRVSEVWGL